MINYNIIYNYFINNILEKYNDSQGNYLFLKNNL